MKGARGGDGRARARASPAAPRRGRPRLRVLRPRGAAVRRERADAAAASARPACASADLVIVMEPTANAIHAGCLGNVNATWTFHGRSGHSARPWLADNAIHRAAAGIDALAQVAAEPHEFDGLRFTQVVSVTRIAGGIADNVIPAEATAHVNFRYAPGHERARTPRRCCARGASRTAALEIISNAPSAPVATANPLVQRADRRPATSPSRPSRRGRRSPSSPPPASTRSTSAPATPPTRTARDEQVAVDALVRSFRDPGALRVRLNPVLAGLATYPFVRLDEARDARAGARRAGHRLRRRRAARGDAAVPAPRRGRGDRARARLRATRRRPGCPSCAPPSPAGSSAASASPLDPDTEVVPTFGSKEAIFHLAQVVGGAGARVAVTTPGYPVPARGAAFAGAEVVELPLEAASAAGCPTSTRSTGTASPCCG